MPRHQKRTGGATILRKLAHPCLVLLIMIMVASCSGPGNCPVGRPARNPRLDDRPRSYATPLRARSASGYPATPKPRMMPAATGDTYERWRNGSRL